MKKISFIIVVFCSIVLLTIVSGFSQAQISLLILIESPNYKLLSKIQSLKTYYSDDSYLIGEIDADNLMNLKVQDLEFQIINSQGWSGEYYILTARPYGPALSKINVGNTIYSNETSSVVKIQPGEAELLFTAGYQLEKITRAVKPLPEHPTYTLAFPTVPDSIIADIINRVSTVSLEAAVQRLEDFQTRYTYSDSIVPAAQWIYDQYVSFGYTDVKFDTFYLNNEPHRNVIVTKPGLVYQDSVIILGGHYDSIVSGPGTNRFVYAPGADDNASGTVAAMEAARVLADHEFEATIKFAAWDAEEVGLVGSAAYAEKAYFNSDPVSLYMNFDMIGNITPLYTVTIYADARTMPYAELTASMARLYTSLTPDIPGNSGGSDHRSFQINGYPAYFVQEGVFSPHWHKPTDVTSNMDFNYMKEVVQMGVATAVYLAGPTENFSGKPFVKYNDQVIDDDTSGSSNGNGNGFIDADETIELAITLKNYGDSTGYDVTATLSTNDTYVTISEGTQFFGTIPSQACAENQNNFVLQVSPDAPSGHKITFNLETSDSQGNSWKDRLFAAVLMPDFAFHHQEAKEVNGNGDDKIDPGEILNLFVEVKNIGLRDATGITSILSCDHPVITILDSLASLTDIPKSGIGNNYQDGFTIEINSTAKSEIIPFYLAISEGKGFVQKTISFQLAIGQGKILLVEDDGQFDLSHYYKDALDILGIPYLHWNTNVRGPVASDTLMEYNRVIWYTGGEFTNSLFSYGTAVMENYLEQGGNLFINGSLVPFSTRDSLIMSKYFHTKYISFDTKLHHLKTDGPKPVLDEIDFWLSRSGDNSQSLKGEIDVQSPAQPILFYDPNTPEGAGNIQSSGTAAVAVADNNYRAVMFSFGWEGIENRETRENVLVKILNWLPGTPTAIGSEVTDNNIPATFELLQNYPNPFNSATTIQFQLPKASQVTIKIFNILGSEMRTLIHSDLEAGNYRVVWNGKDDRNQPVTSGVYFYQITAGDFQKSRKMILIY